ncbi:hypothetical protein JW979_14670 [bacterium]|nr:hypothetical protein [candidate division CSSED10-310 bacterium]
MNKLDSGNFQRCSDGKEQKLLIGVGGYGTRLVSKIASRLLYAMHAIVVDRKSCLLNCPENVTAMPMVDLPVNHPKGDLVAAARDAEKLFPLLSPSLDDVSFALIVAGFGGGVGSGATTMLVHHLRKAGIPVLLVVSVPDKRFDGRKKCLTAELAITDLKEKVAGLVILNPWVLDSSINDRNMIDEMIETKLDVLIDVLFDSGIVSVDMSYIKRVIAPDGNASIAVACTNGENRGIDAAQKIIADPAIQSYRNKPASLIVHVLAGDDLTLFELDEAASEISDNWGAEVDLTYGASMCSNRNGKFRIGVIVGDVAFRNELVVSPSNVDRLLSNICRDDARAQASL